MSEDNWNPTARDILLAKFMFWPRDKCACGRGKRNHPPQQDHRTETWLVICESCWVERMNAIVEHVSNQTTIENGKEVYMFTQNSLYF